MSAAPARSLPAPSEVALPATAPLPPSPDQLRQQVDAVVAGGRKAGTPWPTGVAALDSALGGGIPRGRLTELTGPLAVGKTALLRPVIAQLLHSGAWVAWIDAGRTLAPAPWADLGERFVVIRLPDATRTAWTADLLLRSGVFGLVVLDGAPPLSRVHGVRLAQLARERDAACVVLEHIPPGGSRQHRLAGTVRLSVALLAPPSMHREPRWAGGRAHHRSPREDAAHPKAHAHVNASASANANAPRETGPRVPMRMQVTVEKGGQINSRTTIEVDRVVDVARRMCSDSEIPDRRGVARSARRPWTARGNSSDHASDHASDHSNAAAHHEHPVTWGGLGVAAHDLYGTDLPGHSARFAAGLDLPSDRLSNDSHVGDPRTGDRPTRDWTTYRGRRRAAESGFGRRNRRDLARDRTGAIITSHGGQSSGRNHTPRLGRDSRSDSRSDSRPDHRSDQHREPAPLG